MYYIRLFHKADISTKDFDLIDILELIKDVSKNKWILHFDYGDDITLKSYDLPYDLLINLGAIEISEKHYLLNWDSLINFAEDIYQSIFLVVTVLPEQYTINEVDASKIKLQTIDHYEQLNQIQIKDSIIEIRGVDGLYFEVITEDEFIFKALKMNFIRYEIL